MPRIVLSCVAGALVLAIPLAANAQLTVPAQVLASGATQSSGAALQLRGTFGQPFVGAAAAGSSSLIHGFWRPGLLARVVDAPPTLPLPDRLAFGGASPNPFRRDTRVNFSLPAPATVFLGVFDVGGRLVATLAEGPWEAGHHAVPVGPDVLATGVYFVRFESGSFRVTRKLVSLR